MAKKKDKAKRQNKSSAQQSQNKVTKNEKVATSYTKTKRSKLLLVVGTIIVLFILAIVSLIGIFVGVRTILDNSNDTSESTLESKKYTSEDTQANLDQEDTQVQESISEDAISIKDSDQTQENENQAGLDNTLEDDTQNQDSSTNEASSVLGVATSSSSPWSANDYKSGDFSKATSYTVVSGDTLWEISEAAYGSGFSWTSILNANSSSIGFLPDGSQALIIPGQVLTIP